MHCDHADEKVPHESHAVNEADCEEQQVLEFWATGQSGEDKFSQQGVVSCILFLCWLHLGGSEGQSVRAVITAPRSQPVPHTRSLLGMLGELLDQRV